MEFYQEIVKIVYILGVWKGHKQTVLEATGLNVCLHISVDQEAHVTIFLNAGSKKLNRMCITPSVVLSFSSCVISYVMSLWMVQS